jgi:biotin carboxyl carrier protein
MNGNLKILPSLKAIGKWNSLPLSPSFIFEIVDMLKVKVNNKNTHSIVLKDHTGGTIDEKPFTWDVTDKENRIFYVLKDHRSYTVEVLKADLDEKNFTVRVNGNKYQVDVKDKFDELLKSLGFDNMNANKVNEIKAPMPGLVLDVRVNEGDAIRKGDPVLVLEAMKMENIIKSPVDGTIKKIMVKKGMAVEKNQVLVHFG